MELKDLTNVQIEDLNGIWETKRPSQPDIIFRFENGRLNVFGLSNQGTISEAVKLNPISAERADLVGSEISHIELLTNKFLVIKNSKGFYLLLVKSSTN